MLLLSLTFVFTACGKSEPKEISCEEIIAAYEAAGFIVWHGEHKNETEGSYSCYVKADISDDADSDYIYFQIFSTDEQAKEAQKSDKYNLVVWFYAAVNGECRWLKTGTYGKIEYSYLNPKLIKPFNELIK